jgi:hypothetical protein
MKINKRVNIVLTIGALLTGCATQSTEPQVIGYTKKGQPIYSQASSSKTSEVKQGTTSIKKGTSTIREATSTVRDVKSTIWDIKNALSGW